MANENRIQIVLTTDASGAVTGIRMAGDATQKLEATTKASSSGIQAAWSAMSVKVASWMYVIEKAKGYLDAFVASAEAGAKVMQVEQAYHTLSQTASEDLRSLESSLRAATNYTIDSSNLMQKAIKGITQGLSTQEMIKIGEMARVTARVQGMEIKEAYEKITDAIANEMPKSLQQMGLISKDQMMLINKAIAAGVEDVDLLSLAYINASIKTAQLSSDTETLAEKMAQSRANVQELKEDLQKITARTWDIVVTTTADWYKSAKNTFAAFTKGETWRIMEPEMLYEAPPSTEEEIRLYEKLLVLQRENLENDIKGRTDRAKNADKVKAAAEAYADWTMQVANLNPYLTEQAKLLAENNRQAEKFIAKGVAKDKVEETRALAEYYLKQKEVIEAERELADWQKEMYRMAEEELAYFTDMQGTELGKQISQIDAAAAKIGANLGKLGLDAEEFETRWAEIARVMEIKKQETRDESHKKLMQQLTEQGNKYQSLFDQRRQQQITGYNDIWSNTMNTINQSGDYATGMGMMATNMKGITDVVTGQDRYTLEYERAREHYNQMRELYQQNLNDYGGSEAAGYELNAAYQSMIIANDQRAASMRAQITQGMFGAMAGVALTFYNATGQQSQAAFRLYQAMAIAETTISTIMAAQDAYAWGMKYGGPFAPFVAAAAAGVAIAAGMARVAAISSQKMATVSPATGISAGGGYTYAQSTEPSYQAEQKTETRPLVVNFYNYGFMTDEIKDKVARELVPALQKAVDDGAH
jgi:hypothetical protein